MTQFDFPKYSQLGPRAVGTLLRMCPNLSPLSLQILAREPEKYCDRILVVNGVKIDVNSWFLEQKCPTMFDYPLPDSKEIERTLETISPDTIRETLHALMGMVEINKTQTITRLKDFVYVAGWMGADALITQCDQAFTSKFEETPPDHKFEFLHRLKALIEEGLDLRALPVLQKALDAYLPTAMNQAIEARVGETRMKKEKLEKEDVLEYWKVYNQLLEEFAPCIKRVYTGGHSKFFEEALIYVAEDEEVTVEFQKLVRFRKEHSKLGCYVVQDQLLVARAKVLDIALPQENSSEKELCDYLAFYTETAARFHPLGITLTGGDVDAKLAMSISKYLFRNREFTEEFVRYLETVLQSGHDVDLLFLSRLYMATENPKAKDFIEGELKKEHAPKNLDDLKANLIELLLTGKAGVSKDPDRALALVRSMTTNNYHSACAFLLLKNGKTAEALQIVDSLSNASILRRLMHKLSGEEVSLVDVPGAEELLDKGKIILFFARCLLAGDLPAQWPLQRLGKIKRLLDKHFLHNMNDPLNDAVRKALLDLFPPESKASLLQICRDLR